MKSLNDQIMQEEVVDYIHSAALVIGLNSSRMEGLRRDLEKLPLTTTKPHQISTRIIEDLPRLMKRKPSEDRLMFTAQEKRVKTTQLVCKLCNLFRHDAGKCNWNPSFKRYSSPFLVNWLKLSTKIQSHPRMPTSSWV
jgi:hypothetical protein